MPPGPLLGADQFIPVTLAEAIPISHDTKIFKFRLPDEAQCLGLPIGQHLLLKAKIKTSEHPDGEEVCRKYTPTSPLDEVGFFDIPIKIYYKGTHPKFPEGGKMTQYLDNLKPGESIKVAGPRGGMIYLGNGEFQFTKGDKTYVKKIRNVGMIAGGTGITPCFQILQYVANNKDENLNMSLIYANRSEEDILLRPILEQFLTEQKMHLYYTLDNPPENWTQGKGYVTQEMIRDNLPPPASDTLIVHCGPGPMNFMVRQHLENLGYKEDMIHKF